MYDAETLHDYSAALVAAMKRLQNSNLTSDEKKAIVEFCNQKLANRITKARVVRYVNNFLWVRSILVVPFTRVTKEDLVNFSIKLSESHYAEVTQGDMRRTIKNFYQWRAGMREREFPPIVGWMNVYARKKFKTLKDIPTLDELYQIQSVITNYRDKALFWIAVETGARPQALLAPQLKDVKIQRDCVRIDSRDKNGDCCLWIIVSRRHLLTWLEHHPMRDNPDAPLWPTMEGITLGQPLKWHSFKEMIKRYAKKAGIERRIYPYLLRHRDASWKSDWMTEQQLDHDKGWVQGSNMPRFYVHRREESKRDALLKHYGLEVPENREELKIKRCARCGESNTEVSRFCMRCGWFLENREQNSGIAHTQLT